MVVNYAELSLSPTLVVTTDTVQFQFQFQLHQAYPLQIDRA